MIWIRNRRFVLAALWGLLLMLAACRPLPNQPMGQVEAAAAEPTATATIEAEFVPTLTDMRDMAALQADFNAYPDTPRLILLLSPTWSHCIDATRWVQTEILDKYPSANIHVIAVWMPLVRGDVRSEWSPELLDDARVSYFWDEGRVSGNWFAQHVSQQEPLAWDAYFLYGADAVWNDEPGPLISTGYPIMERTAQLGADLAALLAE